jgi:NAD+ kinase
MTRQVLVVTHESREEAVVAGEEACQALKAAGLDPITDMAQATPGALELAMVLGGDGTILRAAEITHGTGVPVLGVNLGHVGFLAESERDDIAETVRRVQALRPGASEPERSWALNEATLEKSERQRMLEVVVEVDGRPLSSFGCDGIVMSTPTGSTAHAFSAGGPVVWPEVDAILVVPISAHALFARPLVVGPRSVIAVEVVRWSTTPGLLTCDGRRTVELPVGSRIEVRRGTTPVRLARLSQAPFTDRLVSKFELRVTGWRGQPSPRGG